MPYLVANLIEGRAFPVTVRREQPVTDALHLMVEYDYSQLPVTDENKRPLGMINYEGILHGVRNFDAGLYDLHVRDVMASAPLYYIEDDLFELLEQLKRTYAVLIVNSDDELTGIVTSYDSTEFFRNRAEHLMHVEDVEFMIKEFVLLAYTDSSGAIDEERLSTAVAKVSARENGGRQLTFDDLSLGHYVSMLTRRETWEVFEPIFLMSRSSVNKLLDKIRQTRNDLAHFRSEISPSQAGTLRFCAEWLARCRDEYEREAISTFPSEQDTPPTDSSVATVDQLESQPVAEEKRPGESRYAPLADWLQGQPGNVNKIPLSFDEIEAILDRSLPVSARSHRAWWANDSESHPQSRLWLEAGWRTTYINMTEGRVTFMRIKEREKAYIDFFGKLLAALRQQANFSVREPSPDGSSWIVCQTISSPRTIVCQFNYSFTHGHRFRVEMYIDTYEKESTKQIFDLVFQRKAFLESELGNITWERIDKKRASRVAIYHDGTITDSEEKLADLRTWAVDTMIAFYNTMEPVAVVAVKEVFSQ